jgi:thioester reductase-like protein
MVVTAAARGIPVAVYRPGRISGDSRTGVWMADSQFIQSLQTILDLGSWPDVEMLVPYELVPVDYVAQAIVHLSHQPESLGKAFHLVNPQPVSLPELVDKLGDLVGVPLQKLSAERWFVDVFQFARQTPSNFLHALLPMIPPYLLEQMEQAVVRVQQSPGGTETSVPIVATTSQIPTLVVDCTNTLTGLKESDVSCRSVAELMDMYFNYFVRSGLLKIARYEESVSVSGGRHDP